MRFFTIFIIFYCLLIQIQCRPQNVIEDNEGNEVEDKEYEMESVASGEVAREEPRDKEQDSNGGEEIIPNQNLPANDERIYSELKSSNDNSVQFSEYKPCKSERLQEKDTFDINENGQASLKRVLNTYVDNSDTIDQQNTVQHLKYRKVDSNKINSQTDKQAQEEENMLFNINSEMSNIKNYKHDLNEAQNFNERTYSKSYGSAVDENNKEVVVDENYDNHRYFLNRDTREAKGISQESGNTGQEPGNNQSEKTISEDEESAIKRHITKLSKDELEELRNSLTDDKKILLNNVMDKADSSDSNTDNINKREITKKAGAIEENNLIDSELTNSIKNSGVTSDLDLSTDSSVTQNTKNKETEQSESQSESSSMPTSKSAETNEKENKSEIKNEADESKLKSKRETSLSEFSDMSNALKKRLFIENYIKNGQDSYNEKKCDCPQESFMNDGFQNEYNVRNKKRQISIEDQDKFCDSYKSLEESFSNFNADDKAIAYSGPLIRVKRKDSDQIIKKRSAGILPDAKISYFPYKSENDYEETDEGNEFDDEGFYDRTSNFAKRNEHIAKRDIDYSKLVSDLNNKQISKLSGVENINNAKSSLGSDTDSVLSGVEGADDNLMFSSNFRDKRIVSDGDVSPKDENSKIENSVRPLNYQENDAFGPLPRNYEGDLGRYKRIRRLKQPQLTLEGKND